MYNGVKPRSSIGDAEIPSQIPLNEGLEVIGVANILRKRSKSAKP
jgi:hypothetical protein